MGGHGKAVPESRLYNARLEQLPHHHKRIDSFLGSLGRETIHQVRMDHDAGLRKVIGHFSHLCDCHPFFHPLQQPVGSNFQTT